MTYFVNLRVGASEFRAATYDAGNKTLVPVDSRVTIEEGADYWALLLNDEYVMILDADGLSVGDITMASSLPCLMFYERGCGYQNLIASLDQSGRLQVPDVTETDTLGVFNLQDVVSFDSTGMKVTTLNEIWLLATDAGEYVTHGGLLIRLR